MVTKIYTFGLTGLSAFPVTVECSSDKGTPDYKISGLGDASVQESKQRILSAMKNSKFGTLKNRVTLNLSPADVKKSGSSYDLPILVSILSALGIMPVPYGKAAFFGEISLTGELAFTRGVLPVTAAAKELGYERIFVPESNVLEASMVHGIEIYGVKTIRQLADFVIGFDNIEPAVPYVPKAEDYFTDEDFADVKGQENIKTAIQTAAAGFHNVLMIGPPGSGKSMLAKRIPTILPTMSFSESIQTTSVYSVAGLLDSEKPFITKRPFRPVSHTASAAGIVGGGKVPMPGEISLAHNGVMFLDELPEFRRDVLEALRQPLEDKKSVVTRASVKCVYPCRTMLVAAMNPCPCGNYGSDNECTCSKVAIAKYLGKISRPVLDRIDIQIEVNSVKFTELRSERSGLSSEQMKENILRAREKQQERFKNTDILFNSEIPPSKLKEYCEMDADSEKLLQASFDKLGLSARAYDRILKVARTAADIDGSEIIGRKHIALGVQYRSLDRKYWK